MTLEQHGLRDHNSLEVVLTKTLFNYTMRQKLWATSEGSFDTHTFYDRVFHNYKIMSWQAFGVPLCIAICMLMAIKLMETFLRTANRESIITLGGQIEKDHPFQGLCQRNGAGPAVWVLVSSMVLRH